MENEPVSVSHCQLLASERLLKIWWKYGVTIKVFNANLLISRILFGFYLLIGFIKYLVFKYKIVIVLAALITIGSGIKIILLPSYHRPPFIDSSSKTVLIPKGSSLREIASLMEKNDLLHHKNVFILLGKFSGYQKRLQAGLFSIPKNLHPWHLLIYLAEPYMAHVKITIPEGLRASAIASILTKNLEIDSTRFMQLMADPFICLDLKVPAIHLEGYLLPETYFFTYGMDELDIIRIMVDATLSIFAEDSVQHKLKLLNTTIHKMVTLASIIEGEVVVDSERTVVSSVYHNRLARGWPLGADPTIQYIIPGPPRRLLNSDLEIDSPYNTYRYRGLPPGPINNPGKRSILAAIFPANTRYMYFVASGDGRHHFSRTAEEHARWKAKFDQVRREVRRNARNRYSR